MDYTKLKARSTPGASVEEFLQDDQGKAYRLSIPAGKAGQYRLAQLDDYPQLTRRRFPWRPPVRFDLSARASSSSIPGTWGFGLWNDPFGLSLGFGGMPWRLPALPNAIWFFGASKESYLSFRPERSGAQSKDMPQVRFTSDNSTFTNNRASTTDFTKSASSAPRANTGTSQRGAYNGFLAQVFRSPRFHPSLILAGIALPFSRKRTRRLLGKVIDEDGVQLWSVGARSHESHQQAVGLQTVDPTQWHRYRLDWREEQVSFEVDGTQVFESNVSPNPPLGLVIWIDNQYAAFTPEGKIGFGVLEIPEPAWLEIKEINVVRDGIPHDQKPAE